MWRRFFSRARSARRPFARGTRPHSFESLEQRAMLTATPVGSEFTITQALAQQQRTLVDVADVTVGETGAATVAYHARGLAGSRLAGDDREIFVQQYDAMGAISGDVLVANTVTRGQQGGPAIDSASDGSYWVVWDGRGAGDRSGIFAQHFSSTGMRLGSTLLVNETVGGAQTHADVAVAVDGTAVVVWEGVGDGDFDGVFARVINSDGTFATDEVRINQMTAGQQSMPAVAIADFGPAETNGTFPGFVATWSSRDEDGSDWGIYARGFDSAGAAEADAFQVNTTTAGSQYASAIDAAADGSFVIAWSSFSTANGWDVTAQRHAADGTRRGTEFLLHDPNTSHQRDVDIAVASGGEILAAWSHAGADGAGWETQLRTFNEDGTADGDVVIANASSSGPNSGNQRTPAVDLNDEGDSLVVFQGQGTGRQNGAFGQRYMVDVQPAENVAPRLTAITDQRTTIGQTVEIIARATDANSGDVLTFQLEQAPSDAVLTRIDNSSARITWTPDISDRNPAQGSTNIEFRVLVDDDGDPPLRDASSFFVIIDNLRPRGRSEWSGPGGDGLRPDAGHRSNVDCHCRCRRPAFRHGSGDDRRRDGYYSQSRRSHGGIAAGR